MNYYAKENLKENKERRKWLLLYGIYSIGFILMAYILRLMGGDLFPMLIVAIGLLFYTHYDLYVHFMPLEFDLGYLRSEHKWYNKIQEVESKKKKTRRR